MSAYLNLDDVAAQSPLAMRELQDLRAENERLTAWLKRIEGGDAPCTDETQLRRWAYEAVTLGHPAP